MAASRATIGDIEIAYDLREPEGAGGQVPVLFIMGFTMPGRAWRFIVPEVGQGRATCTFDNRGAGESSAPRGSYSMGQLAGDALGLLDHLGWERAHVIAVSMGGMIAQHLALAHPERIASLSLIATHAGGLGSVLPPLKGIAPFLNANVRGPRLTPEQRYAALAKLLFTPEYLRAHDPETVRALLAHDFEPPPPAHGKKAQLRAVLGHNAAPRLKALGSLPTLIIKPGQDALIAPRHSDRLHRLIPNSQLVTLERVGHGLIREVPEALGAILRPHIASAG